MTGTKFFKPYLFLGLALLLAVVVLWVERPDSFHKGDREEIQLFPKFQATEVARIEIERLSNGVQLEREGADWKATQWPVEPQRMSFIADDGKVGLALDRVVDLVGTSIVSKNPQKHIQFEVNNIGVQVRLFDAAGKGLAHFYIGKPGPDFTSSYVRKEGEDVVYLTPASLRGIFATDLESWKKPEPKEEEGKKK